MAQPAAVPGEVICSCPYGQNMLRITTFFADLIFPIKAHAKLRFYFFTARTIRTSALALLLSVSTRKCSNAVCALATEALLTQHKVLSK